jgi:hypothetical protein
LEETSINSSIVGSKSADLDWALVAIEHPGLCIPNRLVQSASKPQDGEILVTRVADTMPDEGARVLIATGTGGVITAESTISTCLLHLEGVDLAVEAWTLRLNQIGI